MADSTETLQDFPLPPASFAFLVESILMQTQIQLGLFHLHEGEEKTEPNLPVARHSIDMLAMLEQKTRGNLTVEEQRLIENGLTELRFRYVQVADEVKRKGQASPAAGTETKKEDDRPLIITADGGKGTKTE
ncbi:MAG: DUF1844 domain-containing protein [Acidobacteriaceae bacterium]|nr:DUF1844 domain-containing protein [Acidobacteriaceae bacterium]MBV8572854.1 DUF1844 domain-containing protein [Acidobacteriaceae bacterium]